MVARVSTVAFHGIEGREVDVQVQMSQGLPAFHYASIALSGGRKSARLIRRAFL